MNKDECFKVKLMTNYSSLLLHDRGIDPILENTILYAKKTEHYSGFYKLYYLEEYIGLVDCFSVHIL